MFILIVIACKMLWLIILWYFFKVIDYILNIKKKNWFNGKDFCFVFVDEFQSGLLRYKIWRYAVDCCLFYFKSKKVYWDTILNKQLLPNILILSMLYFLPIIHKRKYVYCKHK